MKIPELHKIVYALEISAEPDEGRRRLMRAHGGMNHVSRSELIAKWEAKSQLPENRELIEKVLGTYRAHMTETAGATPNIMKRAASLGKGLANEASAVLTGKPAVSEKSYQMRLAICGQCKRLEPGEHPVCRECGCYVKIKARFRTGKCPLGKWTYQ
jgi:hypothetical protein